MADNENSDTKNSDTENSDTEDAAPAPTVSNPTTAAEKNPDEWVTGDEPMTGPQASYLSTLAHDTGAEVPESLSKADASKLIDKLQSKSRRAG